MLPQLLCPSSRERVLIVGLPMARPIVEALETRHDRRFSVVGVVDDVSPDSSSIGPPRFGPLARLAEIVEEVRPQRVLVGLGERRRCTPLRALVESCLARGIAVEDATDFHDRLVGRLALETLTPASLILSKRFGPTRGQQVAARAISVIVAAAALLLFAPLLLLIAIAVKIDSPGPVLFVHTRVGRARAPVQAVEVPHHAPWSPPVGVGARQPRSGDAGRRNACARSASTSCRSSSTCCAAR